MQQGKQNQLVPAVWQRNFWKRYWLKLRVKVGHIPLEVLNVITIVPERWRKASFDAKPLEIQKMRLGPVVVFRGNGIERAGKFSDEICLENDDEGQS